MHSMSDGEQDLSIQIAKCDWSSALWKKSYLSWRLREPWFIIEGVLALLQCLYIDKWVASRMIMVFNNATVGNH